MKPMDTKFILEATDELFALLREIQSQRNMVSSEIAELEREQNDITHRLERPECKYRERAKLATRLADVRRKRRVLKDWLKVNKIYFEYIEDDCGKRLQNSLSNLVGKGRKVEEAKAMREKK
jgi:hypothetical protein